jgi:hypothetical protein
MPHPTHFVASALLYDPSTGTWQATGAMNTARAGQLAVPLQSGQVLVAGGNHISTSFPLGSAELYQPSGGTGPDAPDNTAWLWP